MNEQYLQRMRRQLPDFEAYASCLDHAPYRGLRVNTLKISSEQLRALLPFSTQPIAWEQNGFLIEEEKPGRSVYHDAGLFYVQEPSAMCAAPLLQVRPGERVLDLCSAPGGKGTQLAQEMQGRGVLVLNEKLPDRAKILLQNVERMGIVNAVVTCADPMQLAERLEGYFDKILVDAPCSGEGMFRKEPAAILEWSEEAVRMCAARQRKILACAVRMLAPNGRLVYSTCTFSEEEDEQNADWLVREYPELERIEQLKLYPHRQQGEGHFAACFVRSGGSRKPIRAARLRADLKAVSAYRAFERDFLCCPLEGELLSFGDSLCLVPEGMFPLEGLKVLRAGLKLGERREQRFEPAHALAMGVERKRFANLCTYAEEEILAYLRGEELSVGGQKGWCVVAYDGFPVGLGKNGARMKNHYPKGLRHGRASEII